MAQNSTFPVFIRPEYDPSANAFAGFERSAMVAGNNVKRQFEATMSEITQEISRALGGAKNAFGAIDLNTAGMRQAAAQAQETARETRGLAIAAENLARSTDDTSEATRRYVVAAQAAAREAEEEARALTAKAVLYERLQAEIDRTAISSGRLANEAGQATTANNRLALSQGAVRQASIGAGQQLQDIAISLYSGQRAGVVFAQQLPQMAFALSGLEGSTNKTAAGIGRFASFLSGPWGIAVGLGVGVLATFTSGLFATDDALKNVEFSSFKLNEAQGILGGVMDITTGKINNQNAALQGLAQAQLLVAKVQAQGRLADARRGVTAIQDRKLILDGGFGGGINIGRRGRDGRDVISQQVLSGDLTSKKAVDQLEQLRRIGRLTDDEFTAAATSVANLGLELENLKVFDSANRLLNGQATAGDRNLLVKPRTPRKPRSGANETDKAARAAQQLEDAIDRSADSVARLRGQFDEAPKDIDKAAEATRDLDNILKEIERRSAGGKLTAADRARDAETQRQIEDAKKRILPTFLQRQVDSRVEDMSKELQLQRLILSGRDDEADLLSFQQDLMRQLNVQTQEQLEAELRGRNISKEKLDLMYAQFQQLRENARVQERMDRSVRSVGSKLQELDRARSSIEQSIAGLPDDARASLKGLVGNLRTQVNEIIARRISDNLFGNMFAKLEDEIKGKKPIDIATNDYVASTVRANTALIDLTNSFSSAAMIFRGAANDNLRIGKIATDVGAAAAKAASKSLGDAYDPNAEIVVTGSRGKTSRTEQRQVQDAMEASAKSLKDLARTAAQGAFVGQSASGLIFGNKSNSTGSAIGGAIGQIAGEALGKTIGGTLGSALGPLGGIAGGILGNLAAGLFTKTPRGFATIGGGADGKLAITGTGGNSNSAIKAGNQAAGATLDTLDKIAQALGGTYDAARGSVSIGRSGDSWHVDTSGQGRLKKSQGGFDFDDDYESAVRFATMDLIKDGVISGLKASTQRLLQQGKDVDAALQKALDFESVFTRLKEYRDPVGAALDTLDKEFLRLKSIFAEAGASAAEYADLETLYGMERSKAVEEAAKRVTGSLQSLFDDLTIGDNGRSLRDRLAAAQSAYDPLKARVAAGDKTAYDAYAEAAQSLLEIQRQFSGSQTPYFTLLDEITQLTKQRIDAEKNVVSIAENRDSPFSNGKATGASDNTAVVGAIGQTNQILIAGFRALAGGGGAAVDFRGFASEPFR